MESAGGVPPAEEEAAAGGEKAGAEAAVEPGYERGGNLRDALEDDAKSNHECDDKVALEAECPEYRSSRLRHGQDAHGI